MEQTAYATNIDSENSETIDVYLTDSQGDYLLDKLGYYLTATYEKESDIMATKKYISLEKLGLYNEKIKKVITDGDASALSDAKAYSDSLSSNYESSGAAATALSEAKSYTDTEVAKANSAAAEAQSAADAAASAASTADGKAVAAQGEVDALEQVVAELDAYVGDIPDDYTEETVIAYINKKAEETLNAASGGSSESAASVLAALNTYKSENDPKVAANTEAIDNLEAALATEQERAEGAESGLASRLTTIENDYLVEADKTELNNAIGAVDDKVDTLIGNDANKSVRTIANEELAAQLIAENAAESLDTLEEIAAWIQSHPDDASAMNAAIVALQNKVDTGDQTVSAYVTAAINALSIGDYAKAADLTTLAGRVTNLETASATHATKDEVVTVSNTLTEYKDAHVSDYTNDQIDAAIKEVADDVAALGDTYATDTELATAINNEVARADAAYAAKSLETTVSTHTADTVAHATSDEKTLWNSALQHSDIATGSANGTIAVKGTDVAIKGLGSAAYTESTAYDAAGSASAVQTKLDEEIVRAKAAEQANADAIAAFVEVSEEEINAMFA